MKRIEIAIAAGSLAALGAVAATVWVGASVREDTVVAHPYEDGLRQDAERHARAALGLEVSLAPALDAGAPRLEFELRDRAGSALDDGAVTVELTRPDTSRGERSAPARPLGGGRWSAELAFPGAGPWDVRFDVVRGGDRVRLERRVEVRAPCDLGAGPCARPVEGGGDVTLELSPRPVRVMKELTVRVQVREPPLRGEGAARVVSVSFSMPAMTMGENRSTLSETGPGTYEGTAVLVRCASGRRDWIVDVAIPGAGGKVRTARFPLTVGEEAR